MSGRFHKGDRCGVENCRSKRYVEGNDGNRYCENGHQHAGSTQRADDDDEWNTKGQTTKRKVERQERVSRHLHGRSALELYLYCYQLILWKQAHWLVHAKGQPAELEVVIRDLWALRLQSLKSKVEAQSDTESQSQLFSSQSEGETDTEHDEHRKERKGRRADSTPRLIDTIGLCYIGMLLLRLPVSLGDLHKWAAGGEMIYYNAKESIPIDMKDRLPGFYHAALDPDIILESEHLQTAIQDLAITYKNDCGMAIPQLNYPLLLFRYINDLALPLQIYPATLRLARLVNYTFTFPLVSRRRLRLLDFPETQLIALLVVAVKLHYPFDGLERNPHSPTDTGGIVLDWAAWTAAAAEADGLAKTPGRLTFEQSIAASEKDVLAMNDTELDDYLNWYERTWTAGDDDVGTRASDFRHQLFRMFPTGPAPGQEVAPLPQPLDGAVLEEARERRLGAVLGAVRAVEVVPEAEDGDGDGEGNAGREVMRPGSCYRRYRKEEDLEGTVTAKVFYDAAARRAGMSLDGLAKAVFVVERWLEEWIVQERKREAGLEEGEEERERMDVDKE
ncbi:uncharacterized protein K452DRAFT_362071 [Aplosporella prunicola CBS 121167]|uniref:RRN7-type domain-containing protein n=1 Tax=Aplosporella prunicola CBS 121167 TaxID=1176127 RepID=A0A6A6B2A2_9PEZI|nr:uncharacterized protein K452DRAFT_362071 [Aplosporella prunicola CBS 121167]KAF2137147.1 hypothetical protein K452DRAFT_362071 [Aplosporella prunicola CBS 121167]